MTPISRKTRIILCGQKHFGAAVFDLLQERTDVEIDSVYAPRCSGGGGEDQLARKARIHRVPCIKAGTLRAEDLRDDIDLIIAAHSHDYIGRRTLAKLRIGAIGYHPSLLPRHRGRDAIEWTIRMGDAITGGTVFWLDSVVDGGPIANQDWCHVRPDDDAWRLWTRELSPMGLRLIATTLDEIAGGTAKKDRQDTRAATWEPSVRTQPLFRPELIELGPPSRVGYASASIDPAERG